MLNALKNALPRERRVAAALEFNTQMLLCQNIDMNSPVGYSDTHEAAPSTIGFHRFTFHYAAREL